MSDVPAISAVVALYNKESHIARALNSILAQTFQDFEVIVVNDGSTDNGAAVVGTFRDSRIQLIHQENRGVSAARNRGIVASRADLVAFLDADDEWLPNFLDTIMRLRLLYPHAGIYSTAYEVHFPGTVVQKSFSEIREDTCISSYFGALNKFGSPLFNSSSFAAPKDVLIHMGCFPIGVKWNEDGMLWGKIALQHHIAYSPDICSVYHQYSENNSTKITEYLENPFLRYISSLPRKSLMERADAEDLFEYCTQCKLATISRNVYSGHGAIARLEILSIASRRYRWKKLKLYLASYIPKFGLRFISRNAKTFSFIKWKVIQK
jgi:glycosyltransferase involved in cell wall biosynthesis